RVGVGERRRNRDEGSGRGGGGHRAPPGSGQDPEAGPAKVPATMIHLTVNPPGRSRNVTRRYPNRAQQTRPEARRIADSERLRVAWTARPTARRLSAMARVQAHHLIRVSDVGL